LILYYLSLSYFSVGRYASSTGQVPAKFRMPAKPKIEFRHLLV
jgi:hypothetical protein